MTVRAVNTAITTAMARNATARGLRNIGPPPFNGASSGEECERLRAATRLRSELRRRGYEEEELLVDDGFDEPLSDDLLEEPLEPLPEESPDEPLEELPESFDVELPSDFDGVDSPLLFEPP